MIRIMFVCLGNICRSPMAEFVLRDLAEKRGISDKLVIASSATSSDEIPNGIGNPVYPPARAELERHGVACGNRRAVRLTLDDYDKYDLFIGMDSSNIRNMRYMLGGDPDGKVRKLMDYTGKGGDVADPWYTGNFEVTYRDVKSGCEALLDLLERDGKFN